MSSSAMCSRFPVKQAVGLLLVSAVCGLGCQQFWVGTPQPSLVPSGDPSVAVVRGQLQIHPERPVVSVGGSLQLRVSAQHPGAEIVQPLTWESSDRHIATVNSQGLVRGVEIGRATVTATSANGMSASVDVEVR